MPKAAMLGAVLAALLIAAALPVNSQEKPEPVRVTGMWPGSTLGAALKDLAAQTGCGLPQGDEELAEFDREIWLVCRNETAENAARLMGQAAGITVRLDMESRELRVMADAPAPAATRALRTFEVADLTRLHVEYVNRYAPARTPQPDERESTAAETLLEVVGTVLPVYEDAGSGSAVGERLVVGGTVARLENVAELLDLLRKGSGESRCLGEDRAQRKRLAALSGTWTAGEQLLRPVLWQLFEKFEASVVLDAALMDTLDLSDTTVVLDRGGPRTHADVLGDVCNNYGLYVSSWRGALRFSCEPTGGVASYRVFDAAALLAGLEKEYARQKTEKDREGGFQGDLRERGGMAVVTSALVAEVTAVGHAIEVCSFGTRILVLGSAEGVDGAAEVLKGLGYVEGQAQKEGGK